MIILFLSLILFILSIGFVIAMDLLVLGFPLQQSLDNIVTPFTSLMKGEAAMLCLLILYSWIRPFMVLFNKTPGKRSASAVGSKSSAQHGKREQTSRENRAKE